MRILLAGFQHETNTFAREKADYAAFEDGGGFPHLTRGEAILKFAEVNLPAGGFIKAAQAAGHTILPTIWAGACPSAEVTRDAFERIAGEICAAAKKGGFDAIYLDLHGAMVCEHAPDGEGELIRRLRAIVGPDIPIVASLDLHGNITEESLESSDGLVAYRTYPHVDMAVTGARAFALLEARMKARTRWHKAWKTVPFLLPLNGQCTGAEPGRRMYGMVGDLEKAPGLASMSFMTAFPAADFEGCRPIVFGYGDDAVAVEAAVGQLQAAVVAAEADWRVDFLSPDDAVRQAYELALKTGKPVMIADTQDNPGAGGEANTMGMLRALIAAGVQDSAIGMIYDPAAAAAAHAAGQGATLRLSLGGQSGAPGDAPLEGVFRVEHVSDGRVRYDGPMMHGLTSELGPAAGLSIGGVRVVVGSSKLQTLDRNLFRLGGVDVETMKVVVVKSSVHFRADFEPVAAAVLVAKAPGLMMADPADLPWRHLKPGLRIAPLGPAFAP